MRRIWQVYLLECADRTYYCGITCDLKRRIAQHNGEISGGARYTQGRAPVHLLGTIFCYGKSCALKLEYLVKSLPKNKKLPFFQNYAKF